MKCYEYETVLEICYGVSGYYWTLLDFGAEIKTPAEAGESLRRDASISAAFPSAGWLDSCPNGADGSVGSVGSVEESVLDAARMGWWEKLASTCRIASLSVGMVPIIFFLLKRAAQLVSCVLIGSGGNRHWWHHVELCKTSADNEIY